MSDVKTHDAVRISPALIVLLSLLTALDAMAIDMYLPGMPEMAAALNTDAGQVQLTLAIFLAGLAIGQALYGPLLDRFGRRTPVLAGMALFSAASFGAAAATSVEMLMAMRFLQALGASAGLVSPRAIVSDRYSGGEAAKIFTILMQVMMIAPVLAPIVGGYVLGLGDWRLIFITLGLLGTAGFFWCAASLPDSLPAAKRTPLHPRSIARAYAAVLKNRSYMLYTLASGVALGSLFNYIGTSSFIFTHFYALSPQAFSYIFALNALVSIAAGFISVWLLNQGMSARAVTIVGLGIHAATGLLLAILLAMHAVTTVGFTVILAVAMGSLGLIYGNIMALVMQNAGSSAGVAAAVMGALQYLLSSLIGYLISLFPQGPLSLAVSILLCGLVAIALCIRVRRA
ncbi:multidrug effflux MFS transporter [Erwinia sp. JUb26]|uniref:multidrug effflux MFS transporter n=1 Tax=Erwinia sp. JUb26 TaxID=2485126 RepID=UPI000F49CE93|nr:multidrug effflux MFS transporter [Erwinia sp. JUb26]ROR13688.1 DHA1 family bicyclomycin/chloramphenicol resistance-like MFS transporter [Erwinia sp. JUb26]